MAPSGLHVPAHATYLHEADGGLHRGQSVVVAEEVMVKKTVLSRRKAVIAQPAHLLHETVVIGQDRATFAAGGDGLASPEAEAGGHAVISDGPAVITGAMSLRRVLDQQQIVLYCDTPHGVHVRRLTTDMYSKDGTGSLVD